MAVFKRIWFIVCVSLIASPVYAEVDLEGDADSAPVERIQDVDLMQRKIVIDEWTYKLALDLKVHGSNGLETDFALKEGRQVRFEVSPVDAGQFSTITDIWLVQE